MPGPKRSRTTAVTDFVYRQLRHREAWSSAAEKVAPERGFESLRGHKYCLLTTFRKSGNPVPTPVWFGLAAGNVYLRTGVTAGKVKRIQNNARVRVAPCTFRGRPLGPPAEGRGRILAPNEAEHAEGAIAANYHFLRKLYKRSVSRLSDDLVYVEVKPVNGED